MIRLLATTALSLVLANAALAQSPSTGTKSEQTPPSQSNSTSPSTTSPSGATSPQQTTSQPQQAPSTGTSTQNTQSSPPSSGTANSGSGTSNNAANSTDTSRPQSGTASSNTTGNQPATQQSANPPPANNNQAQQPAASGTNQAQQAPTAPAGNQAQGERSGTNSQAAARTDVNLNKQQETRISTSVSRLNVRPLTSVNFSLNVGTVVPRDVHLSTLPPDVVEIVPQYRGYSFALVKDEIVVVDPATYKIVTVLPYSGQSTATTTTTRERSASKFSDRDRDTIRKHAKTRTEGRKEVRTTGSTARSEIRVGDRLPDSVEVEEFPSTVYRDAPDLREYRYIHRDTRTYVIEPRERRVIEEID